MDFKPLYLHPMDIKQALENAATELAETNLEIAVLKDRAKELKKRIAKLKRGLDAQDKLLKSLGQ